MGDKAIGHKAQPLCFFTSRYHFPPKVPAATEVEGGKTRDVIWGNTSPQTDSFCHCKWTKRSWTSLFGNVEMCRGYGKRFTNIKDNSNFTDLLLYFDVICSMDIVPKVLRFIQMQLCIPMSCFFVPFRKKRLFSPTQQNKPYLLINCSNCNAMIFNI